MKLKYAAILAMGLLPLAVMAQTNKPQSATPSLPPPNNMRMMPSMPPAEMPEKGKLSYAIGMNIGNGLKHQELDVDVDTLAAAIKDVIAGKTTRMTDAEYTNVFNQLRAAMQGKARLKEQEALSKGEAFLAQFAKSPGAKTLPDGLEYKVIKEGDGAMPKDTDTVTVSYRGTFADGTEFDRNDNFTTPIKGRIIQGWQRILPLMKVGSKWQVAIPSSLGYGPHGMGPRIPGNSVLVFDLELKAVKAAPPSLPPMSPAPPPGSHPTTSQPNTAAPTTPVVSGEIIKVPSADELKKGAKIEVIKAGQTNVVSGQ